MCKKISFRFEYKWIFVFKSYRETNLELELKDEKLSTNEYLGIVLLNVKLIPKFEDDEDSIVSSCSFLNDSLKWLQFIRRVDFQT